MAKVRSSEDKYLIYDSSKESQPEIWPLNNLEIAPGTFLIDIYTSKVYVRTYAKAWREF